MQWILRMKILIINYFLRIKTTLKLLYRKFEYFINKVLICIFTLYILLSWLKWFVLQTNCIHNLKTKCTLSLQLNICNLIFSLPKTSKRFLRSAY